MAVAEEQKTFRIVILALVLVLMLFVIPALPYQLNTIQRTIALLSTFLLLAGIVYLAM